jgi:hypothetical protein
MNYAARRRRIARFVTIAFQHLRGKMPATSCSGKDACRAGLGARVSLPINFRIQSVTCWQSRHSQSRLATLTNAARSTSMNAFETNYEHIV